MNVEPQIGMAMPPVRGHGLCVTPQLIVEASVSGSPQRIWRRQWRDVISAHAALAEIYQGDYLHQDDFTTRIEAFFKTCRELADWIDGQHASLNASIPSRR